MQYMSTTEAAKKWGISANRITILAHSGRIPGAVQIGMRWMIPDTAEKPVDGRTKEAKTTDIVDNFRFPLFINFKETDYTPSLSPEEQTLRQGQIAFQACRFTEAREHFLALDHAQNRYVHMSALYHRLIIAQYENNENFDSLLWALNMELSQDFPYKNEMMLLRYGFDADSISYKSLLESFAVDPHYVYHPSAYYVAALASFIPVQNGDFSLMSKLRYDTQELLCQMMERDGHYLEAQKMHYLLAVCYQLQNNIEKMESHIRRGLQIAMDHEFYYVAAFYERWYRIPTRRVLRSFPADFAEKIQKLGRDIQKWQTRFEETREHLSYMSALSGREFEYAFLANQGYTNREIAMKLKVSEKAVSKMYSTLYTKLGVKSKTELIELINGTHRGE